ncbi:MAG: hypothetical protein KDJ16_11140 [Hyphomicrobiales bacterium]|nr:hypothetical protein [Hyphomicrobiales bacterium]
MTARQKIISPEIELWHELDPAVAACHLCESYGDTAAEEASLRIFLAARDRNAHAIRFWLDVCGCLIGPNLDMSSDRPVPPSQA